MRRVLATMTCPVAAITVGGCSGGSAPQSAQSGVATGAGTPTTAAPAADPPTAFDAGAGVPLPTGAFSTNVEGEPGDPADQSGPFVNTSGPRPPVVAARLPA